MEKQNNDATYQAAYRLVLKGQWTEAFRLLHKMLHNSSDQNLTSQLETAEANYNAALQFMVEGGTDPHAHTLHRDMERRLLRLCSAAARDKHLRTGMNIYALNHTEAHNDEEDTENLGGMEELILQLAECNEHDDRYFSIHDSLFSSLFTTPALADEDAQTQLITSIESVDDHLQAYLVSALTLSCYLFFCERKFAVLCHFTHADAPMEVRARALVGIMLIYNRFNRLVTAFPLSSICMEQLFEACGKELSPLYQEWVMVCCTTELHRIIEEKIMPTILKGKNMASAQFEVEGHKANVIKIDATDPDSDPDPKRRGAILEFMRLLNHGADTNFATFAAMKRFDFFMVMPHWLMPFCAEHPLVKRATTGASEDFCNGIMLGTNLCSSDMYSMCSMLSLTNGTAREKMFRSMTNQVSFDEEMDEDERHEALHEAIQEHLNIRRRMRGYLQDWFRLLSLHPAKEELENPFNGVSGLYITPFWKPMMSEASFLHKAARFYYGIEKYSEAIEMFRRYLKQVPDDDDALCQLGRCYMETDALRPAAECFRRAILAGGDETTCLRLLCQCLMQAHNYPALLEALERLMYLCPDDTGLHITKGTALMRCERFEEGYEHYRALEVTTDDADQASMAARGAAWCLFRLHRYDEALERYDNFIDSGEVRHEDLLNRGHVLWALGRTQEAADSYLSHLRLLADSGTEGKSNPLNIFDGDVPDLIATAHVTQLQVNMMRDYLTSHL